MEVGVLPRRPASGPGGAWRRRLRARRKPAPLLLGARPGLPALLAAPGGAQGGQALLLRASCRALREAVPGAGPPARASCCATASRESAREKATRINCNFVFDEKRSLKVVEADFRDLPTPTSLLDIASFEERNAGRLAIVVWKWMHIEWEGATFFEETVVRTPTVHARQNALHVINLLQLEGGHYCVLQSASLHPESPLRPLQSTIQKQRGSQATCNFRFLRQAFACRSATRRFLKYKPGSSAELHPVFVAADLEVFTTPNPHTLGSVKAVQNWVASAGFAVKFGGGYVLPAELQGGIEHCEGSDDRSVLERFLDKQFCLAKNYLRWRWKVSNKPWRMTAKDWREYNAQDQCRECGVALIPNDNKVRRHDHGTSQFQAALCRDCNTKIRLPTTVPVFFHNGGGYDFHFLLKAVEREPCEAENESEEEEEPLEDVRRVREDTDPEALRNQYEEKLRMIGDYKRMAFSVLVKSGERCLSFRLGPLQFLDSANFVKESWTP